MKSRVFFLTVSFFCMVMGLNGMGNPHEVTVSQDSALHITRMPKDIHLSLFTYLTEYSQDNKPLKKETMKNIRALMFVNKKFFNYSHDRDATQVVIGYVSRLFPVQKIERPGLVLSGNLAFPLFWEHAYTLHISGFEKLLRAQIKADKLIESRPLHAALKEVYWAAQQEKYEQSLKKELAEITLEDLRGTAVASDCCSPSYAAQSLETEIEREKEDLEQAVCNLEFFQKRINFIRKFIPIYNL